LKFMSDNVSLGLSDLDSFHQVLAGQSIDHFRARRRRRRYPVGRAKIWEIEKLGIGSS
jgi:hypothetical protein